jgi:hypothetical protein
VSEELTDAIERLIYTAFDAGFTDGYRSRESDPKEETRLYTQSIDQLHATERARLALEELIRSTRD